ncbi:MAG: hypothetical protein ACUVQY_11055 [Thermoproteota archaeon]
MPCSLLRYRLGFATLCDLVAIGIILAISAMVAIIVYLCISMLIAILGGGS